MRAGVASSSRSRSDLSPEIWPNLGAEGSQVRPSRRLGLGIDFYPLAGDLRVERSETDLGVSTVDTPSSSLRLEGRRPSRLYILNLGCTI